ncbi:DUF2793 domain-containing protein [Novosphingobium lentum]|uniref:DUF2793 domain-containing protein n=1 Tax=Novosphingobium lentum TaxID=145287 RepID=UPI000836973D|nr:DUF2793 domain-containing protein [Novosphingobium lentum]
MTDPISFASSTPRFALPLLFSGQAQKEVTVNEALLATDVLLHGCIEAVANTPPVSATTGQTWLVGDNPTGLWAGHPGALAAWSDGGWRFASPRDGMRIFDKVQAADHLYNGGWKLVVSPAPPVGGTVIDAEGRSALINLIAALRSAGIFAAN